MVRSGIRPGFPAVAMIAALLLVGCAHNVPLETSGRIPAAQGKVKVDKDDNGNSTVKLDIDHLATPDKVSPGASTYVVWIQPNGGASQNAGALRVNDDLSGQFEGQTAHKEFAVFITAEPTATATAPSSERLLHAEINR